MADTWVHVGQRGHSLSWASHVEEHWELVHEVANRVWDAIRSGIRLSRHLLRTDLKVILKILDLVRFSLKVNMVWMGNDEIQARELGLDEIKRVLAAIPNVRSPDGSVHRLVRQLIDASVVLMLALLNVLLFECSLDECADSAARPVAAELPQMRLREIARMDRYCVKEAGFAFRISEALDGGEVFLLDFHSERISEIRCGSCAAARTREASSAGA